MIIRKAGEEDVKGIARVHVESWRTTYKDIIPEEYLKNLTYEEREGIWRGNLAAGEVFVAVAEEGEIVGFAKGGIERSKNYPEYHGELYAIYILQEYQGKGIGRRLLAPVIEQLKDLNIENMLVLVLEGNQASGFYEAMGAEKIDLLEIQIAGEKMKEIVYGWKGIKKILVS